jgi:beta-lactamase regulating signal transducer with metallopeptidase domain
MNTISLLDSLARWIDHLDALGLLTDFLVKATLMLLLGLGVSCSCRRWSAGQRFRVLWLAVLAVPIFLLTTFTNAIQEPWVGFTFAAPEALPQLELTLEKPKAVAVEPVEPTPAMPSVEPLPTKWKPAQRWQPMLLLAWLGGVAFSLGGMLLRRIQLIFAVRKWTPVAADVTSAATLLDQLNLVVQRTGLRRVPRLWLCPGWVMPSTWGWWRPAIVLPAEAAQWTAERLNYVLAHEVSHVIRRDALLHFLARMSLALLWFHPLAWLARRHLAVLRESACDDLVVTNASVNPLDYVAELLALVKHHLQQTPRLHPIGLAMAQPSAVGKRIRRLLASGVNREKTSRWGRAAMGMSWMICMVGMSLLVSCRTTTTAQVESLKTDLVSISAIPKITYSPARARAGAPRITYAIMEIAIRDDDKTSPWIQFLDQNPVDGVAFDSLELAANQRGVDLLTVGQAAEGQQIQYDLLRKFQYTDTLVEPERWMMTTPAVKSPAPTHTGLTFKARGELADGGATILTDLQLDLTDLRGTTPNKRDGKDVVTPDFRERKVDLKGLRIPNGGFVILNGHRTTEYSDATDTSLWGLIKRHRRAMTKRWLAISARTEDVQTAKTTGEFKALPGDAAKPKGAVFMSYEVKFVEKEADAPWIQTPPKGPCEAAAIAKFIQNESSNRHGKFTSYPVVQSLADCKVRIESMVSQPFQAPPTEAQKQRMKATGQHEENVNFMPYGTSVTLNGKPTGDGKLSVDVDVSIQGISGSKIVDGYTVPIPNTRQIKTHLDFTAEHNSICLGSFEYTGLDSKTLQAGKKQDLLILLQVKQWVNP